MKLRDRLSLVKMAFSTGDNEQKWARFREQPGFGLSSYSVAGKQVSIESAMALSAFYAGVRVTSQAISSMGVGVYEKQSDGSREAVDRGELYDLFRVSPNADQTPQEFIEGVVAWLLVQGNSYALKDGTDSRYLSLLPMPSNLTHPVRDPKTNELVYEFIDRGKKVTFPREKVWHVKGFGFGGDAGLSAVRHGVNSLGSAMATDETASKMFASGMSASGFLSTDAVLTPEQRAQTGEMLKAYHGSSRAGKTLVLEAGMKYNALSLSPEDAQMLDTRRFNIEEICRWIGVPPIIVGHAAQGQTMWGSGVEQIMLAWLTLGLNPLAQRIEARIAKQLIRPRDRGKIYAEFNRERLLQMDSAAKANFLSQMTQNAIMTRNEARARLNLPRKDGADDLTAQTALAPLETLGNTNG